MQRILIATDGSQGAEAAVTEGLDLAHSLGAQVVFATVRQPMPSYRPPLVVWPLTEEEDGSRATADAALARAREAEVEAEAEILQGDPVGAILDLACEADRPVLVAKRRAPVRQLAAV